MQVSTWMDDYFQTIGVARSYFESMCFSSCFQRRNTFKKITINDRVCLFRFHHRWIFKSKSVRALRRISWEREVHSPHCESRGTSKGRFLESTAARKKNTLRTERSTRSRPRTPTSHLLDLPRHAHAPIPNWFHPRIRTRRKCVI